MAGPIVAYETYPQPARATSNDGTTIAEPSSASSTWPIWTAVALIVTAGAVVAAVLVTRSDDLAMPTTTYGTQKF